jgi:uncharacterized protein DUF6647
MPNLLAAIVVWLSANFGLPATYELPRIERMSAQEMTNVVYQNIPADQRQAMSIDQMRQVISLYSVEKKTIYLRPEWTGRTPAELSVLVHEMVHHSQNLSHAAFECPAARERLAYEAQEKWLNMFGHSLETDFELDGFTLLVVTSCPALN